MNRKQKIAAFIFLLLAGLFLAIGFDSSEMDEICDQDGSYLQRIDGEWLCAPALGSGSLSGGNETGYLILGCGDASCNTGFYTQAH